MVPSGDTLLFVDESVQGGDILPSTAYSFDNGLTYSDWQDHGPTGVQVDALFATASAGRAYLFWNHPLNLHAYRQRSVDAGATWLSVQNLASLTAPCGATALGLKVVVVERADVGDTLAVRARWSFDGGESFSAPQVIDTLAMEGGYGRVTFTQHFTLVGANEIGADVTRRIHVARGSPMGLPWTSLDELPNQPYDHMLRSFSIAADTSSDHAVVLSTWDTGVFGYCNVFVTRTTDAGVTWQERQQLTYNTPVSYWDFPQVFCRGKLYGSAWREVPGEEYDVWGI
jgi:hypothetical protein